MQNRYFFYPVLVNMVMNIMVFVPHILLKGEREGALMSIMISIVIGMVLMVLFAKSMQKFPEKTLSDVMRNKMPRWITVPLMFYFASFWYIAGAIAILSFTSLSKRYLTPETGFLTLLSIYAITALLFAPMKSKNFLYGLEALFLINVPLIFVVLMKTIIEEKGDWLAIVDIGTHFLHMPTYTMIAGATFIFTGYANMIQFGGSFRYKLKSWQFLLIAIFGATTLLTSFLIPILRLGEFAADDFVFPWVVTSDTVSMQYFVIERLMIPFVLVYLMISLVTCSMIWHVGFHMFKSQFKTNKKWLEYVILGSFASAMYMFNHFIKSQEELFEFATKWMQIRFASEAFLVAMVLFLARKEKRKI